MAVGDGIIEALRQTSDEHGMGWENVLKTVNDILWNEPEELLLVVAEGVPVFVGPGGFPHDGGVPGQRTPFAVGTGDGGADGRAEDGIVRRAVDDEALASDWTLTERADRPEERGDGRADIRAPRKLESYKLKASCSLPRP